MAFGLPTLSGIGNVVSTISLVSSDVQQVINAFGPPQWGIFSLDGSMALEPDSIYEFETRAEWRISDFPQEAGAFQSYNKVAEPRGIRLTMTKGNALRGIAGALGPLISNLAGLGPTQDVAGFLDTLETLAASLTLFNVVTPQATYSNMVFEHYDYRRRAESGASLISVDVWMREVRVNVKATYSNTQQPDGADPVNVGAVQPQEPTASESTVLAARSGLA